MLNQIEQKSTPLDIHPVSLIRCPTTESSEPEPSTEIPNFQALLAQLTQQVLAGQKATSAGKFAEEPVEELEVDEAMLDGSKLDAQPIVNENRIVFLAVSHVLDLKPAGSGKLTDPQEKPVLTSIEKLDLLAEKYDVRQIKFEIENQPAAAVLPQEPVVIHLTTEEAAIPNEPPVHPNVVNEPASAEPSLAPAKRTDFEKFVVSDPVVSVRQNKSDLIHLVSGSEKQALGEKSRREHSQFGDMSKESVPITATGTAQPQFQAEFAGTEAVRSVPVIELPQTPPVARKVSIEIGEAGSEVTVTIRERNGDLSLHFDAANESLRRDLETSADSLAKVFEREQLRLTDLNFSNSFGSATDSEHQADQHERAKKQLKQAAIFADKDETYQFHHAAFALKSNPIAS